jgi:hypothetical protein
MMLILKHKRKVDMASIGSTLVLEISKHVSKQLLPKGKEFYS